MWGMRVMIPQKCQHRVLQQLHEGHVGIVKMKLLARSHFWWPGLDQQIENMAKNCSGCLETLHMPAPVPVHPWEWPAEPWQRIHVDYAGPFEKHMFLVIVDAHSKWPEVFCTDSSTSAQTIECLRTTFARFGLPLQLVSDNAQAFVSDEFTRFMSVNGIKHSTSAPYHPATNGLAERFVQTLKQGLRAAKRDEGTLQTKLAKFLASYRNTPHATTNESPAALMFGRPLRTQLDIMKPNRRNEVLNKQAKMLSGGRERHLQTGQEVMVRDYRRGGKWTRGTVHTQTGPRTYQVQVSPDIMWRRHINQMHSTENSTTIEREQAQRAPESDTQGTVEDGGAVERPQAERRERVDEGAAIADAIMEQAHTEDVQEPPDNLRRYPERRHRPPDRLDL